MKKRVVLVYDHGTTGVRACLMDSQGTFIGYSYRVFEQIYPKAGWVEHDPNTLWQLTLELSEEVLIKTNLSWNNVAAIGITNQRETAVFWDFITKQAIGNAIVWQCRRTAFCVNPVIIPLASEFQ